MPYAFSNLSPFTGPPRYRFSLATADGLTADHVQGCSLPFGHTSKQFILASRWPSQECWLCDSYEIPLLSRIQKEIGSGLVGNVSACHYIYSEACQ